MKILDINKVKRPLSKAEIISISEYYGKKIDDLFRLEWPEIGDARSNDEWHDRTLEVDACDSLKSFAELYWCDWQDDLSVLDVDGYLNRDRYVEWPGSEIDESIVKFVFLTAYIIKLG